MLKARLVTALVLLTILLLILFSHSFILFFLAVVGFFVAAVWENFRLFDNKQPVLMAMIFAIALPLIFFKIEFSYALLFCKLCVPLWILRLTPSLAVGLPPLKSFSNSLLNAVYAFAILGCFIGIIILFKNSALYLLSVMAIVWVADIGAYFSGKAFGKRKLAPSISPGKSWEGAIGGWIAVLLLGSISLFAPQLDHTFLFASYAKWGFPGFFAVITVLVSASIVGDLFESQLKRRSGMKDSSGLLPGHGGVLDRIDALIPVIPLAVLFNSMF